MYVVGLRKGRSQSNFGRRAPHRLPRRNASELVGLKERVQSSITASQEHDIVQF